MKPAEVMRFPNTMVFRSTMFGAKLYETAPLMSLEFVAIQIPSSVCPVKEIETYVAVASELCITLSHGRLISSY